MSWKDWKREIGRVHPIDKALILAGIGAAILLLCTHARAQYAPPLTADDVMTIGRGLDKLFGTDPADRVYTDRTHLYDRLQAYITQRNQELAKAKADADKAIADKAIADAVAATKKKSDESTTVVPQTRNDSQIPSPAPEEPNP